ncbi:ROK family transcriptional regulator [Actinosynnema mirum]|uniref:ROK family protein n=1 Tax=Actinosynnema mirum (strain ATCC 29888 / DSM 43827 / JCM 3225 / NBRC 14064 / NCIMB 13271 / NRRL B-12336 / IMRU 3971 / 101) TaxID=446462 RepID=C6WHR0_ACTMD|nr:ROK family transcriptional regulator [Actinosynnema mirum]ACU40009.1 ROK family protein [Actinosynnema mirum DSM 43827]AXX33532.1 ROK-family transcriptional regulator [Actinosynnema pretiosum subsp. pretiosum]
MPNLRFLRGYNDAVVLGLARSGAMTRVELAERSGLTPQAVSKIVNRLIGDGLLLESGTRNVGVGKPRTLLKLAADRRLALGAQVERDELRVVLADLAGDVVGRAVAPLPPGFGPDAFVAELAALADRLRTPDVEERLLGLGIGFVGPLDHRTGTVLDPNGLAGWTEVPLRDLAEKRLGLPVVVDKDTNAAIVAESWRRGEELRDAVLVWVGTGLGAGLLLDGRVHRGARTNAGEFGHTSIRLDGPPCVCGRAGCAEAVHNAAATRGDLGAATTAVGVAVAGLVQVLDVERVVLAGRAVLAQPEAYAEGVRYHLPKHDWLVVDVEVTPLGDDLVAAGAAMLVLSEFYGRPR